MSERWWENWTAQASKHIDDYWNDDDGEKARRVQIASSVIAHLRDDESLVEVGCGSGLILEALRSAGWKGRYLGLDVSEAMLAIARDRFPEERFERDDVFQLSQLDRSADVVVAFDVFCHLPEIDGPLREMYRVARRLVMFSVWSTEASPYGQKIEEVAGELFIGANRSPDEVDEAMQRVFGRAGKIVRTNALVLTGTIER